MGSGETTPRPGTAPSHYSTTTPGEGKQGERHRPSSCPARKEPPGHWVLMANPYPARLRSDRFRPPGDLEERVDALQDGCAQFEKQAAAMKNKFWMENLKAIIAGSVVGLLVLGLIYWKFFMPQPPPPGYGPPAGGAPPPQAPVENAPEAGDGGGDAEAGGDAGGGDAGAADAVGDDGGSE